MPKRKACGKIAGGILALTAWAGIAVIASQFVVGWTMLILLGGETLTQPVSLAVCSALSYVVALWLIIYVPPALYAKWQVVNSKKKSNTLKVISREELGLKDLPTWTDIGLAPVGFIVYLLAASLLSAFFSQFAWFDASEAQDVGFSFLIGGFDRVVAFVTLVLVAPIAEEIIFRGWLYGKLREKTSEVVSNVASVIISALLVSVLFGLVHMQWNVGVSVFAMSLVLCALREITGTIYAGILLHMLKNGVAFYLLYMIGVGV